MLQQTDCSTWTLAWRSHLLVVTSEGYITKRAANGAAEIENWHIDDLSDQQRARHRSLLLADLQGRQSLSIRQRLEKEFSSRFGDIVAEQSVGTDDPHETVVVAADVLDGNDDGWALVQLKRVIAERDSGCGPPLRCWSYESWALPLNDLRFSRGVSLGCRAVVAHVYGGESESTRLALLPRSNSPRGELIDDTGFEYFWADDIMAALPSLRSVYEQLVLSEMSDVEFYSGKESYNFSAVRDATKQLISRHAAPAVVECGRAVVAGSAPCTQTIPGTAGRMWSERIFSNGRGRFPPFTLLLDAGRKLRAVPLPDGACMESAHAAGSKLELSSEALIQLTKLAEKESAVSVCDVRGKPVIDVSDRIGSLPRSPDSENAACIVLMGDREKPDIVLANKVLASLDIDEYIDAVSRRIEYDLSFKPFKSRQSQAVVDCAFDREVKENGCWYIKSRASGVHRLYCEAHPSNFWIIAGLGSVPDELRAPEGIYRELAAVGELGDYLGAVVWFGHATEPRICWERSIGDWKDQKRSTGTFEHSSVSELWTIKMGNDPLGGANAPQWIGVVDIRDGVTEDNFMDERPGSVLMNVWDWAKRLETRGGAADGAPLFHVTSGNLAAVDLSARTLDHCAGVANAAIGKWIGKWEHDGSLCCWHEAYPPKERLSCRCSNITETQESVGDAPSFSEVLEAFRREQKVARAFCAHVKVDVHLAERIEEFLPSNPKGTRWWSGGSEGDYTVHKYKVRSKYGRMLFLDSENFRNPSCIPDDLKKHIVFGGEGFDKECRDLWSLASHVTYHAVPESAQGGLYGREEADLTFGFRVDGQSGLVVGAALICLERHERRLKPTA